MRSLLAAILLLWPAAVQAETDLTYEGGLGGAAMIEVTLHLADTPVGYELRAGIRPLGAVAALFRGRSDIVAQGLWQGDGIAPTHLDSEGYWNGEVHRMIVDYVRGTPVIRVMQPTDPERRRALSRDDVAGTVDAIGLIAELMHQMAARGRCDAHERVFDGRGVTDFRMTTGTPQLLPRAAEPYTGPALRCDFSTRKVAGQTRAEISGRVDRGYVLFAAAVPGLSTLPIRIVFQRHWLPDATVALKQVNPPPSGHDGHPG